MSSKVCHACGKSRGRIHFNKVYGDYLCRKHYDQFIKHGELLDYNPLTALDPNEFEIDGDVTYLKLRNSSGDEIARAKIDTEDLDVVSKRKWNAHYNKSTDSYYAVSTNRGRTISSIQMSRFILKAPEHLMVDHINHDTLDNRRVNLRLVTNSQNQHNLKSLKSNNKSGFNGVYWDSLRCGWKGQVRLENKVKVTPTFDCAIDAAAHLQKIRDELGITVEGINDTNTTTDAT